MRDKAFAFPAQAPASPREQAQTQVITAPKRARRRGRPWILILLLLILLLSGLAFTLLTLGQPRTVPDLQNAASMEEAERIAAEAGDFEVVEGTIQDSEEPEGAIISQTPAAGETLREGSRIYVIVSGRQVAEVPDVGGQTSEDATQALEEAGFEVEEETGESSESYEGYVTEQDPRGGRNAEVGSTVTITVGGGPPMQPPPTQPAPTPTTDVPDPDVPTPDVPASDVRPSTPAQPTPSSGAATPTGGSCSPDSPIKGNHSSSGELIYHVPGGQSYNATNPEECFANEEEAQSAGYRASKR